MRCRLESPRLEKDVSGPLAGPSERKVSFRITARSACSLLLIEGKLIVIFPFVLWHVVSLCEKHPGRPDGKISLVGNNAETVQL